MGGSRAAKRHALSLSQPLQPSEAVNCGLAGPAEGRAANLHAGDADQDGTALRPRRANGKNARLGGRRVRRLHAELKTGIRRVRQPNGSEMAKRAHSLMRAATSTGTKCRAAA